MVTAISLRLSFARFLSQKIKKTSFTPQASGDGPVALR